MVLGGGAPDEPVYFDDVSLTSASVSGGANPISNPAFTNLTVAWTNYGNGPLLTQTRVHCKRQTNPLNYFQIRDPAHLAGVSWATSASLRRFIPGNTSAR